MHITVTRINLSSLISRHRERISSNRIRASIEPCGKRIAVLSRLRHRQRRIRFITALLNLRANIRITRINTLDRLAGCWVNYLAGSIRPHNTVCRTRQRTINSQLGYILTVRQVVHIVEIHYMQREIIRLRRARHRKVHARDSAGKPVRRRECNPVRRLAREVELKLHRRTNRVRLDYGARSILNPRIVTTVLRDLIIVALQVEGVLASLIRGRNPGLAQPLRVLLNQIRNSTRTNEHVLLMRICQTGNALFSQRGEVHLVTDGRRILRSRSGSLEGRTGHDVGLICAKASLMPHTANDDLITGYGAKITAFSVAADERVLRDFLSHHEVLASLRINRQVPHPNVGTLVVRAHKRERTVLCWERRLPLTGRQTRCRTHRVHQQT